jgi:hypothetical protein
MAYPQQDRGDTFAQDRDGSPSYGKQEPSYGKQPDGYFQYVNVPAHKEYEFGWNRGNPHHYISRYEQSKEHRFRTRVRWGDKHGGYGEQYWEYNHGPQKGHEEPHKSEYHAPPKYHAAAA